MSGACQWRGRINQVPKLGHDYSSLVALNCRGCLATRSTERTLHMVRVTGSTKGEARLETVGVHQDMGNMRRRSQHRSHRSPHHGTSRQGRRPHVKKRAAGGRRPRARPSPPPEGPCRRRRPAAAARAVRAGRQYLPPSSCGATASLHARGLTPVRAYSSQQGMLSDASLTAATRARTISFFMPLGGSPRWRGGGLPAYVRLSKRQRPNLPGARGCERVWVGGWWVGA